MGDADVIEGDTAVVDTTGAKETFGLGRDEEAATAYVGVAVDRTSSLDEDEVVIAGTVTGSCKSLTVLTGKAREGRAICRRASREATLSSNLARRASREEDEEEEEEEAGRGGMTDAGSRTEADDESDASEVRDALRRATV